MYLLHTNVVSELTNTPPDPRVMAYFRRLQRDAVFTSAVCLAEIRYGLERLPVGRRRTQLTIRVDALLTNLFVGQILPFDDVCASVYGALTTSREQIGKLISPEDGMIAATAKSHDATLLTRNVRDFVDCGITIVNPWVDLPPP